MEDTMKETQSITIVKDQFDVVTEKTMITATGQESSVTITQGANGKPRHEVKVYDADPDAAAIKAVELYFRVGRMLEGE